MPAPLYQDAISYLRQNGQPISTSGLNAAMAALSSNPGLRPSYVQDGGGQAAMMANMGVPTDQLPLAVDGSGVGGFDSPRLPSDPNILAQANALAAADRQAGGPMPPMNEFADRVNGQWMNGGGGDQYSPGAVSGSELPPPGGVLGMMQPSTPMSAPMQPSAPVPMPKPAMAAPPVPMPKPVMSDAAPPPPMGGYTPPAPPAAAPTAEAGGSDYGALLRDLMVAGAGIGGAALTGKMIGGARKAAPVGNQMRPRPATNVSNTGSSGVVPRRPGPPAATPKAAGPAPQAAASPTPAPAPAAASTPAEMVANMTGEKTTTPPMFTPQPPKATEGTTSVNGGPMKTKAQERRKPGATRREKTAQAKQDDRSKSRTGVKRAAKRAAVGTAGAGAAAGAASSSEAGEVNKGEREGRKLVAGAKEQLAQLQRTGGTLSEITAAKVKVRNAEDKAKKWTKAGGRY